MAKLKCASARSRHRFQIPLWKLVQRSREKGYNLLAMPQPNEIGWSLQTNIRQRIFFWGYGLQGVVQ